MNGVFGERYQPKTDFLKATHARARVTQAYRRLAHLENMERLLYKAENGLGLGPTGYLLNGYADAFPVSFRTIQLSLRYEGTPSLIDVSEAVELKLGTGIPRHRIFGRKTAP